MNPNAFIDAIKTDNDTALSRLGSSKAVYADTQGEMETEDVLTAAATAEQYAAATYEAWADDSSEPFADVYGQTAAEERDHYDTIKQELPEHEPGELPAIHEYLRELDDDIDRLGGFIGRTLAAEKSKEQITGFFVGQANPQTAQLFRGMGDDLEDQLDRAMTLLADQCGDDDACWEQAKQAATDTIQTAYTEYTNRLEAMGVNPKPVC